MKRTTRFLLLLLLLPLGAAIGCTELDVTMGVKQIQLAIYTPLCIDVQDASTASGAHVQAYPCGEGKRSQEWYFKPVNQDAFGQFTIVNANSQMCMTVLSGPNYPVSAPGEFIVQEPCAANDSEQNQIWTVPAASGGEAGSQIVSLASSQCLDLPYGAVASIFVMQQYTCTDNDPAQGWILNPVTLGSTP
jgi:Ricin-type beta-trefoil lectin domain